MDYSQEKNVKFMGVLNDKRCKTLFGDIKLPDLFIHIFKLRLELNAFI
jgi:hypothetical protein